MKITVQIDIDHQWLEQNMRELENDGVFQRLQRQKSVALPAEAQRLIEEVQMRGTVSADELANKWGDTLSRLGISVQSMVNQGHLVDDRQHGRQVLSCPVVTRPPEPLSDEQMASIRSQLPRTQEGSFIKAYVRQVYQNFGVSGLRVIEDVMQEMGSGYAAALSEASGRGPQVVGLRFIQLMKDMGSPVAIVESTPDRVRFRVERCAYELGRGETDICRAVSAFDRALVSQLGCVVHYHHVIPEGSAFCEGLITAG